MFSTNIESLARFSGQLEDLSKQTIGATTFATRQGNAVLRNVESASSYAQKYTGITSGYRNCLFEDVKKTVETLSFATQQNIGNLGRCLSASSTEIYATALKYSELDDTSAAQFDALYPSGINGRGSPLPSVGRPSSFDATQALVFPTMEIPTNDLLAILTADPFSPSFLITRIFEYYGLADPFEAAGQALVGDWNVVYQNGSALAAIAEFLRTMKQALLYDANVCMQDWKGNAADSAQTYFSAIATDLQDNFTKFNSAADALKAVAEGLSSYAQIATDALREITNAVVIIIIATAAGTISFESGIGPAIAAICDTAAGIAIGKAIANLQNAISLGEIAISAFKGVEVIQNSQNFTQPEFTAPAAYDNAQV